MLHSHKCACRDLARLRNRKREPFQVPDMVSLHISRSSHAHALHPQWYRSPDLQRPPWLADCHRMLKLQQAAQAQHGTKLNLLLQLFFDLTELVLKFFLRPGTGRWWWGESASSRPVVQYNIDIPTMQRERDIEKKTMNMYVWSWYCACSCMFCLCVSVCLCAKPNTWGRLQLTNSTLKLFIPVTEDATGQQHQQRSPFKAPPKSWVE